MTLYANTEKLTELMGTRENIVNISDKIIFFGELNAWKRSATATHKFLDVDTVYTKAEGQYTVGKFVYNRDGDLYVITSGSDEYCYYVKSYDASTSTIKISYDTYNNIKNGTLSGTSPLGEEEIVYERNATSDIKL